MPELTPSQIEQFYQVRLDPYKLHHSKGAWWRSVCPLHGGSNHTQFAVNFDEGQFRCFSCDAKGSSPFYFEMEMLRREWNRAPLSDEVWSSIEKIILTPIAKRVYPVLVGAQAKGSWDISKARDKYQYVDEDGAELYTVYRFVDREGKKMTPAARPCACKANPDSECPCQCSNGIVWSLEGVRRVLYRLPDVMQALYVFIVEGERNANDLHRELSRFIAKRGAILLPDGTAVDRIAVTTNSHGAQSWKKEHGFGRYLFGKTVVKLGDNDTAGRLHDKDVCDDVAKYAKHLFTLELPVGESEDISDYLERNTVDDFLKLLPTRKPWVVADVSQPHFGPVEDKLREVLTKPSRLLEGRGATEGRDWLVPGLIARNTRGLVVAPPKTGKSLMFLDLTIALATDQSFLGAPTYGRPVRCAIISREDGPEEVYFRLRALARGRELSWPQVDANISVNTSAQTSQFRIDNPKHVEEMSRWLQAADIEFCVLDVLSFLHGGDENSSNDMTKIMQSFTSFAAEAKCQVCIIAHTNKAGGVKGSTAIEGWADYIIKLEPSVEDDMLKTLSLRTKSKGSSPSRTIRYWQSDDEKTSKIVPVEMRTK